MQTVPSLFALANGIECAGPHKCFYCSAPCGEARPSAAYVRDSFTGRNDVACPGSCWICEGCVLCLREDAEIPMIDGSIRTGQKVRCYSWDIRADSARAGSKADLAHWRQVCLNPPSPPFAVVLSDSGQKHLLYRGVVCHSRDNVTVTLEGERIEFAPAELDERLKLCAQLVAAAGKPSLLSPIAPSMALSVIERYPAHGEGLLLLWESIRERPLSRLGSWLCANREACQLLYPSDNPAAA